MAPPRRSTMPTLVVVGDRTTSRTSAPSPSIASRILGARAGGGPWCRPSGRSDRPDVLNPSYSSSSRTYVGEHRAPRHRSPLAELAVGQDRRARPGGRIDPEERAAAAEVAERARRVPRARPVRRLRRRAARSPRPQSFGSWRPNPGSTPARPGNCTVRLGERLGGDPGRRRQLPRQRGRSRERARAPDAGEPSSRSRSRPDGAKYFGERHLRRARRRAPPRPRSRSSSRCADGPAARSAARPRAAARRRARGGGATSRPAGPAGSSRSTRPSSAATSTATAVASFVTEAHAKPCPRHRGRLDPDRPRRRRVRHCHVSTCSQGLHGARLSPWSASRISSGAAFEERVGYSRAVRVGDRVSVSGTAPIMPDDADPPAGAYDQARSASGSSARARGSRRDARRRRADAHLRDRRAHIDEVGRAHAEAFGRARPATTGVVTALLDPRWLVEIEVEAVILPA